MISPVFLLLLATELTGSSGPTSLVMVFYQSIILHVHPLQAVTQISPFYIHVCVHCNEWELNVCMLVAAMQDIALFIIDEYWPLTSRNRRF